MLNIVSKKIFSLRGILFAKTIYYLLIVTILIGASAPISAKYKHPQSNDNVASQDDDYLYELTLERDREQVKEIKNSFVKAAASGDIEKITIMIKEGISVDTIDDKTLETGLMWAARNGYLQIVKLLLENSADINRKSLRSGETALLFAVTRRHLEIVNLLISANAEVNITYDYRDYECTALTEAIKSKNIDIIRALLSANADVNVNLSLLPLMVAINTNKPEIVKLILDAGANVNARSRNQYTALTYALEGTISSLHSNNTIVIQLLLNYGANVNEKNSKGETPLTLAKKYFLQDIVTLLINNGATD